MAKKKDKIGSNKYSGKLVPISTVGNWFQKIQRKKQQQRGIGSNQYGAKLISTNTAGNILRETVPTKTAGHWFQSIWREIGSNQYSGKTKQQGIGSNQCSGKLVPTNAVGNILSEIISTNTVVVYFDSK